MIPGWEMPQVDAYAAFTIWMTGVIVALVAMKIRSAGGWIALRYAWTGEPPCPSCRIPMRAIATRPFPVRSYDVWVCMRCTNAVTRAVEGDIPECGACHQRSLLTPTWRLPADGHGDPAVQVHEHCPVCGHDAIVDFPEIEGDPKLAVVIPFPGRIKRGD